MIYFDMPARFAPGLEKEIIDAVHEVTPDAFNATHDAHADRRHFAAVARTLAGRDPHAGRS